MKKILSLFPKAWAYAQKNPGYAAIKTGLIVGILSVISLSYSGYPIGGAIIIGILFGAILGFGTVFIYGEKQSTELSRAAVRSADQVVINESIIQNAQITGKKLTKDDLVRLDD